MQFWYVNNNRERIFGRGSLVIFFAITLAILVWLFPQQTVFRKSANASEVDAVSIAYLEVLLRAAPDDVPLRLNLIHQLSITGQLKKALQFLQPVLNQYPVKYRPEIDLLHMRIVSELSYSTDSSPVQRIRYREKLTSMLKDTKGKAYDIEQRKAIAELALANSAPAVAAAHYLLLAELQPELKIKWLSWSAEQWLAANEHDRAATIYGQIAGISIGALRSKHLLRAAEVYRMIGNSVAALELFQRLLVDENATEAELMMAAQLGTDLRRDDVVRRYATLLMTTYPDSLNAQKTALSQALAIGALNIAAQASMGVLRLTPDNLDAVRLTAQIHEWQGDSVQALNYWQMLAQRSNKSSDLLHMRQLAQALYDYDAVIEAVTRQAKNRQLNEQQIDALIIAYELNGDPEGAVAFLNNYLLMRQSQLFAWRKLAFLQERMANTYAAVNTWVKIDKHLKISLQDSLYLAGLHARLDDSAAALQTLAAISDQVDASNTEFWNAFSQYAWIEEDEELARLALEKFKQSGLALNSHQTSLLLSFADPALLEWQIAAARRIWTESRDPLFFLSYVGMAWQQGRWDEIEQAFADLGSDAAALESFPYFWMIRASLAERNERFDEAEAHHKKAMLVSAHSTDSIQTYLWFLTNRRRHADLKVALRSWEAIALAEPELWSVFASAHSSLGNYSNAQKFFAALTQGDQDNLNIMNAYADTLDLVGQPTPAWRLRRKIWERIQSQDQLPIEHRIPIDGQIRLSALLAGEKIAHAFALQHYSQQAQTAWLPAFTDHLIAASLSGEVARWRQLRKEKTGQKMPLFQRVAMAYLEANHEEMQSLLDDNDKEQALYPALVAGMQSQLQRHGMSMAVALEHLEDEPVERQSMVMRRLLSQQVSERPSGLRSEWTADDMGGITASGPQLSWAQHWDNWHGSADIKQLSYDGENLVDFSAIGDEQRLETRFVRTLRDGAVSVDTTSSLRDDSNVFGLGLSRRRVIDSKLSVEIGAQWQGLADKTALSSAFATNDYIDASLSYSSNARNSLVLTARKNKFYTRRRDYKLATGSEFSASLTHRLNFADPEFRLKTGVQWMQNSVTDEIPNSITQHLVDPALGADGLLPKEYGQVFVGAVLQHGDVHAINARVPAPRYFLDLSVSHEWTQNQSGFFAAAGFGIPIFGNDELSFSYNFNSAPIGSNGNAAQDFRLSYSYRFGR